MRVIRGSSERAILILNHLEATQCHGAPRADEADRAGELYADRRDYLLAIARRNAHTEADATEALQEAFASFIAMFDPVAARWRSPDSP
jgi:DNA-directed RNA polymerase specialized sigma24 family protein